MGGKGYNPGEVAVGRNDQKDLDVILAHEIGHNFSLQHVSCGKPNDFDTRYPYLNGGIGSYGADLGYTTIFEPTMYDVMSYCFPHNAVSDYQYEKAQDYLNGLTGKPYVISAPISPLATSAASANYLGLISSVYLRIAVDANGARVAQQITLPHLPKLQAGSGHHAQVEFADGSQMDLPVVRLLPGHGGTAGEYQLQVAIPTQQQPQKLTIFEGQKTLLVHPLNGASFRKTASAVSGKNSNTSMPKQNQLSYRGNEVCVDQGAYPRRANLLWHHDSGVIALALNENSRQFCRSLEQLPVGEAELQVF